MELAVVEHFPREIFSVVVAFHDAVAAHDDFACLAVFVVFAWNDLDLVAVKDAANGTELDVAVLVDGDDRGRFSHAVALKDRDAVGVEEVHDFDGEGRAAADAKAEFTAQRAVDFGPNRAVEEHLARFLEEAKSLFTRLERELVARLEDNLREEIFGGF